LAPLGFVLASDRRHFSHPSTDIFLEFPPAPLQFGNRILQHDDVPRLDTRWGPLRVITPTLCVMDRLAAFWHWHDRQSSDQPVLVARHHEVDDETLSVYATEEGADPGNIDRFRAETGELPMR